MERLDNISGSDGVDAGSRIRTIRLERRLKQASLASEVGVSPSYLNLIEHNRRRIAPDLLERIAVALGVAASDLTAQVPQSQIDDLMSAASLHDASPEISKASDLALRFPGWTNLIVAQTKRIKALELRLQELSDRLSHDPDLAASLHEVISAATSIRSTASILNGDEELDADWLKRFHRNLHSDAIRLSESSDTLISYLEAPDEGEATQSPLVEAESFLADRQFFVPELEQVKPSVDALLERTGESQSVRRVLWPVLEQYVKDAASFPLAEFEVIARDAGYDPAVIANRTGGPLATVMRRLASLPPNQGHPPIGFVRMDAAGFVTLAKNLPGILFPRSGACPLWPVFAAAGQPGRPIRQIVSISGAQETKVLCFAVSEQHIPAVGEAPRMETSMLLLSDPEPESGPIQKLGPSCRICPRTACDARREPSVVTGL